MKRDATPAARSATPAARSATPAARSASPSIRELETLRAMIESRKLIAAAARLGVTQSAVSRGIDSLEEKVGMPLFRRDKGRLVPTSNAFALNDAAGTLFEGLARVARWPNVTPDSASLRTATSASFAHYLVPDLVARYCKAEPAAFVAVEIFTGSQVVSAVAERQVDVGIVDYFAVHPGVKAEVFRRAQVYALMLRDHPLARKGDITAEELKGTRLIMQSRRFVTRTQLDLAFQLAGVVPDIVSETVTAAFAFDLMLRGTGVALISPYPASLGVRRSVVARRFVPTIQHQTALIFPASGQVSVAARRFADLLLEGQPDDPYSEPVS